jgi:hypothetical protein
VGDCLINRQHVENREGDCLINRQKVEIAAELPFWQPERIIPLFYKGFRRCMSLERPSSRASADIQSVLSAVGVSTYGDCVSIP